MDVAPAALGYLLVLLGVGVVSFVVGLRLGARAQALPPLSEDEQVAAAFGVLKRRFEKEALAEMQASGAPLWSPDPARVAELSYGARLDGPVLVGRNTKAGGRSPDQD
ncbi:hypothetical protein [Phenylobacterium sp.]|uniref:hypothetical protein n=1 Tax=Phenylobacterium sp. TaxID=1871053 RepID=UPI00289DFF03|nr:hypothetical protein [Phenylobacterium sp.]